MRDFRIIIDESDGETLYLEMYHDDDLVWLGYGPDNDIDSIQEIPIWKHKIPTLINELQKLKNPMWCELISSKEWNYHRVA